MTWQTQLQLPISSYIFLVECAYEVPMSREQSEERVYEAPQSAEPPVPVRLSLTTKGTPSAPSTPNRTRESSPTPFRAAHHPVAPPSPRSSRPHASSSPTVPSTLSQQATVVIETPQTDPSAPTEAEYIDLNQHQRGRSFATTDAPIYPLATQQEAEYLPMASVKTSQSESKSTDARPSGSPAMTHPLRKVTGVEFFGST